MEKSLRHGESDTCPVLWFAFSLLMKAICFLWDFLVSLKAMDNSGSVIQVSSDPSLPLANSSQWFKTTFSAKFHLKSFTISNLIACLCLDITANEGDPNYF